MSALGYIRDAKDDRDKKYDFDTLGLPSAGSSSTRLFQWAPRDQGALNACVGFAGADALFLTEHEQDTDVAPPSALAGWSKARRIAQPKGRLENVGCQIRDLFKAIKAQGLCDEAVFPQSKGAHAEPGILANFRGYGRKGGSYHRIFDTGHRRIEALRAAIAARHPVVFGVAVSVAALSKRSADPIDPPSESETDGNHAMLLTGFNDDGNGIVRGSWGKRVGIGGYHHFAPDYLLRAFDMWICRNWRNVR